MTDDAGQGGGDPARGSNSPAPGPAVDPSRLENLRQVDPGLVAEIASLWLDTTPTLLAAMTDGVAAGDAKAAETAAHALRGSSANLGADALAEACSAVEVAARGGIDGLSGLSGLVDSATAEYHRAAGEFALLAGRSAS